MLFHPDRHEPLVPRAWDAGAVRAALRAIVDDAWSARAADGGWPLHPLDDEGAVPRGGFKGLYLGRAGVLWALWTLERVGAVEPEGGIDWPGAIAAVDDAYRADPDSGEVVPSYYLGEVGLLMARWRIAHAPGLEERLHGAIFANRENPTLEALWGAPGTMVAAWHLWRATGHDRWRALFLDNVDPLWRAWQYDEASRAWLWTQDLYGRQVQYLGAGHGFAGNVFALLLGAQALDPARREALYQRCEQTLQATAQREAEAVNWPPGTWAPRPGSPSMLVQWCHGAPGFVTALAPLPRGRSASVDALLEGAGECTWRAGPLTKGPGLCHGTAGNGAALLALYGRTGDTRWLDRARAFAMHAIGQCEGHRARYGRGRYTLWTGDLGLALYLWQCIEGRCGMPTLDFV